MKLRPTGKRLLVQPIEPPATSVGGVILPDAWKQPSGHAHVLAVGQQVQDIQPGDRVMYSWINGREVEHDGQMLRLLHQDEVLAVEQKVAA